MLPPPPSFPKVYSNKTFSFFSWTIAYVFSATTTTFFFLNAL